MLRPDPDADLEKIDRLLLGELPVKYAGFRLEGKASKDERETLAVSGLWPRAEKPVTSLRAFGQQVNNWHFETFLLDDGVDDPGQFRRRLLKLSVSDTIQQQQARATGLHSHLNEDAAWLKALRHNLPGVIILFGRFVNDHSPHTQIWHPDYLPTAVSLKMIQESAEQAAARDN